MNPADIKRLFPHASQSTLKANTGGLRSASPPVAHVKVMPRVAVTTKPSTDEDRLNKTERAYLAYVRALDCYEWIGIQNITLKLADDTRFTPDFTLVWSNGVRFVDTKGGFWREDARIKIKMAARLFLWAEFVVAHKEGHGWKHQVMKP